MINDVDDTIKKFLELEFGTPLPFDISFSIPDSGFAPLSTSRQTVNFYLYNISREQQLQDKQPTYEYVGNKKRARVVYPPAWVKLTYCVTAWSPAPSGPEFDATIEEHKLLSIILRRMLQYPDLPREAYTGELKKLNYTVPISVIIQEENRTPWDFWNALGGKLKPYLGCTITFPMDYRAPEETGVVEKLKLHYKKIYKGEESGTLESWTVNENNKVDEKR